MQKVLQLPNVVANLQPGLILTILLPKRPP